MSAITFPTAPWHRAAAARRPPREQAEAREQLPRLARGERILLRTQSARGRAVVGTDRAIHVAGPDGWQAIAWLDVDAAGWDPTASQTVLRLWPDGTHGSTVTIPTDHRFAVFVAERVASTQVLRRQVRVSQQAVAVVVALRNPGDDSLHWRVQVVGAGDGDRESTREAAGRVLAQIRRLAGC